MSVLKSLIGMAFAFATAAGGAKAATVEEWRQDLDRVVADVRATHPAPFAKVGELNFIRAAEAIKADLPRLTEEQRVVRAMALVALLGDGHSQLQPDNPAFAHWYPFRAYEFDDGYFLTGVHKSIAELAGAQILSIDGRPVAEAAAAARALMGADNRFDAKERLYPLMNAGVMKGLSYAAGDGALRVRLRLANGKSVERTIAPMAGESPAFEWTFRPEYWGPIGPPEDWVSGYRNQTVAQLRTQDLGRPPHLMYRRAFFAYPMPDRNAYYIQVNVVGGTADESLPAFFRRALAEVDLVKPEHLIVDIRYNFGGDGSNVLPVLHQFIARKFDPPWRKLYLLTGRKTFSAAVLMTDAFIDHMQPTIVGEPAGAPLNTFGDTNSFRYAATGMKMFVSFERHEKGKSTDVSRFIPVDYPATFSFDDYAAGRDPAVDAILNGSEVRSIPAIAATDGAAAAHAVYLDRKARFAGNETWRPTTELDLRIVMRELDDLGRTGNAIEVATLNAQINPQEWRTWMNLGDLQMKAGAKAVAVEDYRRSVGLNDPTNFNADRLRGIIAAAEREAQPVGAAN